MWGPSLDKGKLIVEVLGDDDGAVDEETKKDSERHIRYNIANWKKSTFRRMKVEQSMPVFPLGG